jgi:hypothetical protein
MPRYFESRVWGATQLKIDSAKAKHVTLLRLHGSPLQEVRCISADAVALLDKRAKTPGNGSATGRQDVRREQIH